jgi:uncharacterized alpha-E superfamily protein
MLHQRFLLSRVANSLFWMSRYIERAENIARIVDVNLRSMLDHRGARNAAEHPWRPLVESTGDDELFFKLYKEATGPNVTEFLTFRTDCPDSIISCVAKARENARIVRDQLFREVWEEINRLYLFMQSDEAQELCKSSPVEFFNEIKDSSLYFQGLTASAVSRTEGWHFMEAGKYLERADKTTRILDIRHTHFAEGGNGRADDPDIPGWGAVLRSCSAWDAYRQVYATVVSPRRVAEFLLLSDDFPRSVHYSLGAVDVALRNISGVGPRRFSNDAEKLSGRLLSDLQFSTIDDVLAHGFHGYLDLLQQKLNELGDAIFATYMCRQEVYEASLEQQQQQ